MLQSRTIRLRVLAWCREVDRIVPRRNPACHREDGLRADGKFGGDDFDAVGFTFDDLRDATLGVERIGERLLERRLADQCRRQPCAGYT